MVWRTRSLREHVTAVVRAFTAHLPGADAALARNNLRPTAQVIGGGLHALEAFAAWAADQRFVLTCDADQLDRHGAEMKPPVPRKDAQPARGTVLMTTVPIGATLVTGAVLQRSDGVAYTVDVGVWAQADGTMPVQVTAVVPGADGAAGGGLPLTAASGLNGPATFEVASGGLGGAADRESDEAYRARLLFAKAFPDHAGAVGDWLRYTMAIPGVTRAFIDPLGAGRGTVVVYPFFDDSRPNGIPLESDRAMVEAELRAKAPGAGLAIVRIPQPLFVNIVIGNLVPASPEVRNAVVAEIANSFFRNSRVAGWSSYHPSMPFLATPATFSRSWVWQAVANASGEQSHVVLQPGADFALAPGQTAVPGTVSFA